MAKIVGKWINRRNQLEYYYYIYIYIYIRPFFSYIRNAYFIIISSVKSLRESSAKECSFADDFWRLLRARRLNLPLANPRNQQECRGKYTLPRMQLVKGLLRVTKTSKTALFQSSKAHHRLKPMLLDQHYPAIIHLDQLVGARNGAGSAAHAPCAFPGATTSSAIGVSADSSPLSQKFSSHLN